MEVAQKWPRSGQGGPCVCENVAGWRARQSGIRHLAGCIRFLCPFRGRHFFDPASESKAKRWQDWHTAGILNTALCRWRWTSTAKRIKLGLQRALRSLSPRCRSATRPASATRQDRDIFPADSLSCVWQPLLWTLASDATHFIKRADGGRGEGGGRPRLGSQWFPQALPGEKRGAGRDHGRGKLPDQSESRRTQRTHSGGDGHDACL